ncbi:MAG TPA: imidazole glycerol phosphate synthase subunit HisH [Vicinamibacterales bacterium]
MIALIDYRAGNLTSVRKALAAVGADVSIPTQPHELSSADGVIVPGVGHFGATRALDQSWVDAIRSHLQHGRPLLGICLGMQWLYERSDESPDMCGLGLFAGTCTRLIGRTAASPDTTPDDVKVPHVGWNTLTLSATSGDAWISRGVLPDSQVYFTHSYAAPVSRDSVAVTTHGGTFAAIVERGSVAGVQFHPEKSGQVGLQILRNFVARTAVVH